MIPKSLSGLFTVLAAGLLTGCISLLPESEPVQLYRFGDTAGQEPAAQTTDPGYTVLLAQTAFNRAAAGDRILTITGSEASYIQGARWVSPAQELFDNALRQAFDYSGGPARLVDAGDVVRPGLLLQLQVHTFEARYTRGQGIAPDVVIEVRATLSDTNSRTLSGQRAFRSSELADDNRVGAIVAAFDRAVTGLTGELVAWVNDRDS